MNSDNLLERINIEVIREFDKNNFQIALDNFENIIAVNPDLEKHYSLKGNILFRLGKIDEAIKILEKGITKTKDTEGCYAALGYIEEKHFKNYKKAHSYYEKSLAVRETAPVLNNYGVLYLMGKGTKIDNQKAEDYFNKALKINPKYYQAHQNKAMAFTNQNKYKDALLVLMEPFIMNGAYKFDESHECFERFYRSILIILNTLSLQNNFQIAHAKILLPILRREIFGEKDINAVLRFSTFKHVQNFLIQGYRNNAIYNPETYDETINLDEAESKKILYTDNFLEFCNSPFLTIGISNYINVDLTVEYVLSSIRKLLLIEYYENPDDIIKEKRLHKFISSICMQCYMNEYIWTISDEENNYIDKLEERIEKNALTDAAISSLDIYILGSYKSFHKYKKLKKFISDFKLDIEAKNIIKNQFLDINEEKEIRKEIPIIGPVEDRISLEVKNQYENNPYPRWASNSFEIKRTYLEILENSIFPNKIDTSNLKVKDLLIAGCGTGFHPLNIAISDKSLNIDAIDISLSSLSYAKRKAKELNVNNISFYQCDILNIDKLEKKYDAVECSGVLHHMENPQKGFDALTRRLKKGGVMKIALYARSFRRELQKAKDFLKKGNTSTKIESIRENRDKLIMSSMNEAEKSLIQFPTIFRDFYTTSEFIDLLMHVQEHDYNTEELKNMFKDSYDFLGFTFQKTTGSKAAKAIYGIEFPDDKKMTNLDNWSIIEKNNSATFMSMYQFWLQKR